MNIYITTKDIDFDDIAGRVPVKVEQRRYMAGPDWFRYARDCQVHVPQVEHVTIYTTDVEDIPVGSIRLRACTGDVYPDDDGDDYSLVFAFQWARQDGDRLAIRYGVREEERSDWVRLDEQADVKAELSAARNGHRISDYDMDQVTDAVERKVR